MPRPPTFRELRASKFDRHRWQGEECDGTVWSAAAASRGLENARQRQYQPTMVGGKPVEVQTEISIEFSPDRVFCTSSNENVYITGSGCAIELGNIGLQAAGAGGL